MATFTHARTGAPVEIDPANVASLMAAGMDETAILCKDNRHAPVVGSLFEVMGKLEREGAINGQAADQKDDDAR